MAEQPRREGSEATAAQPSVGRRSPGASQTEIEESLGFVCAVARRFSGYGLPFEELVAAGNLGLVEAATRYDRRRNVKFTTFAAWWIRKAMLETLKEQTGPLRVPRYQFEKIRLLQQAREEWIGRHHEPPDEEQLARAARLTRSEVRRLSLLLRGVHPLEQVDNERPLLERLADTRRKGPLQNLMLRDLARRLGRLTPREREVLERRFGLRDGRSLTLRETAREVGLSRERVRQIETLALLRLRTWL